MCSHLFLPTDPVHVQSPNLFIFTRLAYFPALVVVYFDMTPILGLADHVASTTHFIFALHVFYVAILMF